MSLKASKLKKAVGEKAMIHLKKEKKVSNKYQREHIYAEISS